MEYNIITNNRKVLNFFSERSDVYFLEELNVIEILDFTKFQIYEGRKLLSDPITANVYIKNNPFKSILVSKNIFKDNENFKFLIDGAIRIAYKVIEEDKILSEIELEEYRSIDLSMLINALNSLAIKIN